MGNDKKIILFGSGQIGKKALQYFGQSRVYCFVDNNEKLIGETIHNIPVISFLHLKEVYEDYQIVISTDARKAFTIAAQLEDAGIGRYETFFKMIRTESKKYFTRTTMYDPLSLGWGRKNRVLIVTHSFPLLSGCDAFPSIKSLKYLPQYGWHPTVLVADHSQPDHNYGDEALLKEVPIGISVIRVPDPISTSQEHLTPEPKKRTLEFLEDTFQDFKEVSQSDISTLLLSDSAWVWSYRMVRYIEALMDIHDFRVIYTASGPYSIYLVGYYFKRKYGIPWVTDYQDQRIGDSVRSFDPSEPYDQILLPLESIFLRDANCNITQDASGSMGDRADQFQLSEEKNISITNEYTKREFSDPPHSLHIEEFEQKASVMRLVQAFERVKGGSGEVPETTSEYYDVIYKSDEDYSKHYSQSPYYSNWKEAMKFFRNVDHAASILEIGCGPGQFANMLFDNDFTNYTGLDYSAEAISIAKKNNPKRADRFFAADAFQTELLDRGYDLVVCFEVLEHILEDLELLQRIRPGVRMLLSVPNFNSRTHVRYFSSAAEIWDRYRHVMRISDIHTSKMNQKACLYYIWGEKL